MRPDDATMSALEANDRVEISIPARSEYLHLLRLCVAGVAAEAFSLEEVDDLKIAIEELAAVLLSVPPDHDSADSSALNFGFELVDGHLSVVGRRRVAGAQLPDMAEFLSTILDAVVDSHGIETDDAEVRVQFEKRARGG